MEEFHKLLFVNEMRGCVKILWLACLNTPAVNNADYINIIARRFYLNFRKKCALYCDFLK